MFELKISCKSTAYCISNIWDATHVISLLDCGIEPDFYWGKHLILHMNDIVKPNSINSPNFEHISKILNFTNYLNNNDRILIHCHAGISRSVAVAIGIMVQHGYKPEEAIQYCIKIRPQMYPNELIAHIFDIILDRNDIENAVLKFQYNNKIFGWCDE